MPLQQAQPIPPTSAMKRTVGGNEIANTQSSDNIFKQHKRRKPTDRSLPAALLAHDKGLLDLSKEYEKLLEYEKNLDSVYARKRLEMSEDNQALKRTVWKRLRVRVSNTCENQSWQQRQEEGEAQKEDDKPDFDSGKGVPSWTVKVEGKLLDVSVFRPSDFVHRACCLVEY